MLYIKVTKAIILTNNIFQEVADEIPNVNLIFNAHSRLRLKAE